MVAMERKETDEARKIAQALEEDKAWAEYALLNYDALYKDYERRKQAALIVLQGAMSGGRGSLPGKPTENMAVRAADYDMRSNDYAWLSAVRIVESSLSKRKKIFLNVRRQAEKHVGRVNGKVPWVAWTYVEYGKILDKRYKKVSNCSERTMKTWWRELVEQVRLVYLKKSKKK